MTIRAIDCDEAVVSRKRGVCANRLDAADFRALAPGVSWWYNWHYEPGKSTPPADVTITFLPMVWGDDPAMLAGLQRYLAAGHTPPAVLAINEPNLRGQAFIPPQQTAELMKRIAAVADEYRVPVVGPNLALGSPPGESIRAVDPITKQPTTYTFMIPFLKATNSYGGFNSEGAGIHVYGNVGELKWAVASAAKASNQPVWVTEFAQWNAKDADAERTYLMQAVDFLERSPEVAGYAWFKERAGNHPLLSLLSQSSGKLTPLGEAYVHMPVHDADVYYRLPGKLQAENYATMTGADLYPTTDADGFAEMRSAGAATLTYNIVVSNPGRYLITIRAKGAGTVRLRAGDSEPLSVAITGDGWQTVSAETTLTAGPQALALDVTGNSVALNWLDVQRR